MWVASFDTGYRDAWRQSKLGAAVVGIGNQHHIVRQSTRIWQVYSAIRFESGQSQSSCVGLLPHERHRIGRITCNASDCFKGQVAGAEKETLKPISIGGPVEARHILREAIIYMQTEKAIRERLELYKLMHKNIPQGKDHIKRGNVIARKIRLLKWVLGEDENY